MRLTFARSLCILILSILSACSSGYNAYKRGDYLQACNQAVDRLKSDPKNLKAQNALAGAYSLAVKTTELEAISALKSKNLSALERSVTSYTRLNAIAEGIRHTPGALAVVPEPVDYLDELYQTRELVAGICYDRGLEALRKRTLSDARTAVDMFTKVNRYQPGYRDTAARLEEALLAATMRVVVTRPVTNLRYELDAGFFYAGLMDRLSSRNFRYPVRFYTPEEATSLKLVPHQIINLSFADYTVGNTRESSHTSELKREDVVVGTTTVDGRKQDVRGTVTGKLTVYRLEVASGGIFAVRVIDGATDKVVNRRDFTQNTVWAGEWAKFYGDVRVLTDDQKKLLDRKAVPPPPAQELFASFAEPLYAKSASYIGSLY